MEIFDIEDVYQNWYENEYILPDRVYPGARQVVYCSIDDESEYCSWCANKIMQEIHDKYMEMLDIQDECDDVDDVSCWSYEEDLLELYGKTLDGEIISCRECLRELYD